MRDKFSEAKLRTKTHDVITLASQIRSTIMCDALHLNDAHAIARSRSLDSGIGAVYSFSTCSTSARE